MSSEENFAYKGHPIIIRVKRRRDQEPSQSLVIVEADRLEEPLSKKNVSTAEISKRLEGISSKLEGSSKILDDDKIESLILTRMFTLPADPNLSMKDVDARTIAATAALRYSEDSNPPYSEFKSTIAQQESYKYDSKTSIWIPKGKKMLRNRVESDSDLGRKSHSSAYFVVDMNQTQSEFHDPQSIPGKFEVVPPPIAAASAANGLVKLKIQNPLDRMMSDGINNAWKVGDFNPISNAIIRGSNVNFQSDTTTIKGLTPLMAAVKHCNIRMVNRLLDKGASVFLRDQNGMSALDHQASMKVSPSKESIALEIRAKLQQAASKQYITLHSHAQENNAILENSSFGSMLANEEMESVNYVYDIFCSADSNSSSMQLEDKNLGSVAAPTDLNASIPIQTQSQPNKMAPVIPVEGIHITASGGIELNFAYDSDWSDLGDDEDPDSNDERHHGNDYPDEDEGDEEDDEYDGGYNDDSDDSDHNNSRKKSTSHRMPSHPYKTSKGTDDLTFDSLADDGHGEEYDNEDDFGGDARDNFDDSDNEEWDESNDQSQRAWRGRQKTAGHVVHYDIPDDPFAPFQRNTQSLQRLWGEEQDVAASDHHRRLDIMKGATGMEFASDPGEFDRSGLPKNGFDLGEIDDEDINDMAMLRRAKNTFMSRAQAYTLQNRMPFGNSSSIAGMNRMGNLNDIMPVAYDSELDHSGDEDENDGGYIERADDIMDDR